MWPISLADEDAVGGARVELELVVVRVNGPCVGAEGAEVREVGPAAEDVLVGRDAVQRE
eukprot:CAMPEP_0180005998 /NCGR_PEP_ID=MMETSP0984-20121128/13030_1 /TAXON_ID=483367 /ORGANISM="non described non described, Strain CCMP 2436" /LENGTH=58 /DNA_ID=CAMNT_0021926819 /DNA_START=56 /DNA_END=233 /DNA_ORIENTATION=+